MSTNHADPYRPISHTILVVEEDDAIRTFLADQLTADEYTIYETADLDRALAQCTTRRPDAAIIDVNGGSGRAFATRVRGGTTTAWTPAYRLVLLGTTPGELDAVRAFEAGADDYVVKPFSYPALRALCGSCWHGWSATRAARR